MPSRLQLYDCAIRPWTLQHGRWDLGCSRDFRMPSAVMKWEINEDERCLINPCWRQLHSFLPKPEPVWERVTTRRTAETMITRQTPASKLKETDEYTTSPRASFPAWWETGREWRRGR